MDNLNDLIDKEMSRNPNEIGNKYERNINVNESNNMNDVNENDQSESGGEEEWKEEDGESEESDEDLEEQQKEFILREEIGKGQDSLDKYKHCLESSLGVFLPMGLKQRDQANQGLGRVEKVYQHQIKFRKFQEWIKGVCDYDSLMHWLLNHDTRKYIFTRIRTVKGSNKRQELPTKVDHKYLIAIALNFGGISFSNHQDAAWKAKHGSKFRKMRYKTPKFLKPKPEYIIPSKNKKKSIFNERLSNHMDRESLIKNNPAFELLQRNKIITSRIEFNKWLDQVKSSKLNLNGHENALEINKLLQERLLTADKRKEDKRKQISNLLRTEAEKQKDEFIDLIIDLGIDQPNYKWIEDFESTEFEQINKRLKSSLQKIDKKLEDPLQKEAARKVISEQVTVQFNSRLNE